MTDVPYASSTAASGEPAWGAIYAIGFSVAGLTAAEMLPVSLLTPMAADLHVSQGAVGQVVTATAVIALLTSLFVAVASNGLNRRTLLVGLSILQVVSNLTVALAPNLTVLIAARLLLGLSVGGFWAMSAALVMRLVPAAFVPKAYSVIFGGIAIATVAAAPLGSYLESLIGWRGAFLVATAFALVALAWQFLTLPSMPSRGQARLATLFHLLKRQQIRLGMVACILVFTGHGAFFTYLRAFLGEVTGVGANGVSLILLAFGIGSLVGSSAGGWIVDRSLWLTLALTPLLMSIGAAVLAVFGNHAPVVYAVVALWGFAFGTVPVGWSTWLTRTAPDEVESGGGLLVAAIQLAITMGAAVGGVVFDRAGAEGAVSASGLILLVAALTILFGLRSKSVPAQ